MKQKYNKKRRKRRKASAFHPPLFRPVTLNKWNRIGPETGKMLQKRFWKIPALLPLVRIPKPHISGSTPSLPPARPPALPPPHQIFHPQWENILEDININPILNSGRKPNPERPGDGIMEAPPALPSRSRPDSTSGIGDIRLWRRQQVPPTNHSAPARLH